MLMAQTIIWIHLVIFILHVPLALRMVRRNRFYGFRVPKTLGSDAIWYPANALAGRLMALGSIAGIAIVDVAQSGVLPLAGTSLTLIYKMPQHETPN